MAAKYKKPQLPDFKRVIRAFKGVRAIAEGEIRDFAQVQANEFKVRIRAQDFPSFNAAPLSPAYAKQKERLGLDPRVMIATGHYVGSIRVFSRKNSDGSITFYVGHDRLDRAEDKDGTPIPSVTLNMIAAVHEKGSSKMNVPARPHWKPHLQDMEREAKDVRARVRGRVRAHVKGKLGTLAKP